MEKGCDMYIVYSYIVSRSTSSLERRETNQVATNIEQMSTVPVLCSRDTKVLRIGNSRNLLTYTPVAGTALSAVQGLTISPYSYSLASLA